LWLPTQVFLSSRGGIPDAAVPRGNDFGPAGAVPGMRVFQVFIGIREVSLFQAADDSVRHPRRVPHSIILSRDEQNRSVRALDGDRGMHSRLQIPPHAPPRLKRQWLSRGTQDGRGATHVRPFQGRTLLGAHFPGALPPATLLIPSGDHGATVPGRLESWSRPAIVRGSSYRFGGYE